MLRRLILTSFLAFIPAGAAMWPDKLGTFERQSEGELHAQSVPDEYGREASEEADYGAFKVSGVRFKDSTGAYAASLEIRDRPLQVGNYLITCSGKCPKNLAALADALPRLSHLPVSVLKSYLPAKNMVPRSERYIMGPAGLHNDLPQISESAVALQFGAEGAVARYRLAKGEATLAIFSYPTLEMARQQAPAYEKTLGVVVKRSGALVALVAPAIAGKAVDAAEARKLLDQVNYQASFS